MFERLKINIQDVDAEFTEVEKQYIGYIGEHGEIKPEQIPKNRPEPLNGIEDIPDEHYRVKHDPVLIALTARAKHEKDAKQPDNLDVVAPGSSITEKVVQIFSAEGSEGNTENMTTAPAAVKDGTVSS